MFVEVIKNGMKELLFKTRGQEKPTRKQKVYFMHHPDDFDRYFNEISNEILAISDCAIAYYRWKDDATSPVDQPRYEAELEEMRLFVLPITTNLLTRPNRALDFEFGFALNHNIPVLPLMQENGLEELFNKKCGDLQYLDKNARDDTAIGYEVKLRNFLESVLISDKLCDYVRAAFEAYIFLSYRKKDREYAQSLMKLIHQNDFCRDIAIWYDEFLTPGENFNDSIRQAIDKCNLFALAVTPNLLEKGNYVLENEYPHAVTTHKPILAVELEPTNHSQFQNQLGVEMDFSAPDLIGLQDHSRVSQALLEHLGEIAKKPRRNDPQHNFFIGLAYLGGIDVERDADRAFNLIRGAAEGGLVQAMKKLASMYHNGEGVKRNYQEEIRWLEQLTEKSKECYDKSQDYYDGINYFWVLWNLGNAWLDLMHPKRALEVFQAQCDVAESLIAYKEDRDYAHYYMALTFKKLGNIYNLLKQKKPALMYLQKALAVAKHPSKDTKNHDEIGYHRNQTLLASCYYELGDTYFLLYRFWKSKRCYKKYLSIRKALAEETGTVEDRRELSIAYDEIANLSCYTAKGYYEKSMAIREELAKELNTLDARYDLSFSYSFLGDLYRWLDKEKAKKLYNQALEIQEEYVRERNTVAGRTRLAATYLSFGSMTKDRAMLERAYRINCELAEQCSDVWFYVKRRDMAKQKLDELDY